MASIATPNFLEAQTRAKVSRVRNDARTLALALEAYAVDNNRYPARSRVLPAAHLIDMPFLVRPFGRCDTKFSEMKPLTTPIAYVGNLPIDVFNNREPYPTNVLDYWSGRIMAEIFSYERSHFGSPPPSPENPAYVIVSDGPDGELGYTGNLTGCPSNVSPYSMVSTLYKTYDPTNGTVSYGNIFRLPSGSDGGSFFRR